MRRPRFVAKRGKGEDEDDDKNAKAEDDATTQKPKMTETKQIKTCFW
jgi:hypothetical protein